MKEIRLFNTRRIPAAWLTLLLLSASLAACGDTATAGGAEGQTTISAAGSEAVTEAVTEPAEYVDPGVDYGGETVTIGAIDYYTTGVVNNWKACDYCEVFSYEENGDPLNDAIFQRNRDVSETLNVAIELYSFETLGNMGSDMRKLIMAAEDIIDIALINGSSLKSIIGGNMLVDLNTIPTVDFSHTWWDQNSREELTIMDSMYAVTGDISLYISYAPIVYFFNKNLVETLSMDDPYALVRSGDWTLDRMIRMSTDASSDLNGDGTMDPVTDRFGMMLEPPTMERSILSVGVNLTTKDKDGIPYLDVDVDGATKLTETMAPFMNNANTTLLSSKISGYNNVFSDLFLPTFMEDRALFFSNQLLVALNLRNMSADFGILPQPKMDENQKDYYCTIADWWGTFAAVPITNMSLDMTGHVMDAMGYYGQKLVTPAYIETTVLDKALRDDDSAEMVNLILSNRVYDLAEFYDWGGVFTMFSSFSTAPNKQFASSFASSEKKIIAAIEKTIGEIQSGE